MMKRLAFWVTACGVLLGLIYTVFFSSFFVITHIELEKNGNVVQGAALSPFLERMKGKNILFLNTDRITHEIEQTFNHELLFASISKSYPRRLTLRIEEYPAALNVKVTSGETVQKLVVNQLGYAIFENAEDKTIPTLLLQSPTLLKPKSVVMDQKIVSEISSAFQKFNDLFGIKVPTAEWKKVERELHLKTEKNFTVWIDLTADVTRQLLKLKRALVKLDIHREPLEYIDLRIAGGESEKVIFKRKGT